jgi:uncharacterized membrane protein
MESLIVRFHLHPIIDHFTIALLSIGVVADVVASVFLAPLAHRSEFFRTWHDRLKATGLQLLIVGALAVVLSRFTGESEAERLWDTISPAAQRLLWSDAGSGRFLSHAILGTYLMYAFVGLALWRVLQEISRFVGRTRFLYLAAAIIVTGALFYQGKTGGEMVYDQGVGTPRMSSNTQRGGQE